jgi:N-acetylglucosamine kinase-like BadF-type ATPase
MTEIGRTGPTTRISALPPTGDAESVPFREGVGVERDTGSRGSGTQPHAGDAGAAEAAATAPAALYEGSGSGAGTPSGCVIALDGGGTKVNAVVTDSVGRVLGGGTAGPCNIASMTVAEAFASARAAGMAALTSAGMTAADVTAVCAGVAGTSFTQRRVDFAAAIRAFCPNAAVAVEPDYAIALTGATGGSPGIVVIAGTGSVAYGEDARGRGFRAGAYGYLIDDAGSGYGVGRQALAAVLKAADHTGKTTKLTKAVLAALELQDVGAIISGVYGGTITRVKIAALANTTAQVAHEDGDEVAAAIIVQAANALAQLAAAVAHELFPNPASPFPIVATGSMWKAGAVLTDAFRSAVHQLAPGAVLANAKESPLLGAVRRAVAMSQGA